MAQLLTVVQAAEALNVHKQTVYRLIWGNELPWVNISRSQNRPRIRIRESAIEQYTAARERGMAGYPPTGPGPMTPPPPPRPGRPAK